MSDMPELRDGPPWAMEEMIQAEPGLVAPIMASSAALEAAESIREGGPITIVGCGTSEHAAMAGAHLIDGARARDAFEASLDPQHGGVLIAISHEAGTAATLAAMRAAAANGARTILVTAKPEADTGADIIVGTPLVDTSWCHTVGYVSPLLALTAIAGTTDADTASRVIEGTLAQRDRFAEAAAHPRRVRPPDRLRQRRRRGHRARDLAQDRGGRARPGHAARHREGPARPPARGRRRHRPDRLPARPGRGRAARQARRATCSPRPPSSRCRRS